MSHGPQGQTSPSTDPPSDSFQECLCLICRQVGHIIESCPLFLQGQPPVDPPFEPFSTTIKDSALSLCERCNQMDALSKIPSHRPFVLEDYDDGRFKTASKKTRQIPSLGPIRSLQLHSSCPLCCLLFDITHLTEEDMENVNGGGDLVAVTAWTIYRLEKDLYWPGCEKGKGPYAKCVYTSVTSFSSDAYEPTVLVEEAMDAIGLVDTDQHGAKGAPSLGVRKVDPQTCDYKLIRDWLHRCDERHHITCRPITSEGVKQIKLIDVETRQIVRYPADMCDYITLSYVWGGVEQTSYKLGDILSTAPATLEDAMLVTRNLGKRYLWADSLCIDQENDEEKAVQIDLMSAIYTGAWATIICLSGQSAQSGLPRVGTLQGVIPQLSCEVWGKQLLSVMPNLSQQLSWSPWAARAWTFQEALLSSRRIFFTNHQVYFECNAVQCCESLDDSHSPFHVPTDAQRRAALDKVVQDPDELMDAGPEGVIGRGIFRDPFRPLSTEDDAQLDAESLETYFKLVHTYTAKKMSYDADSLNAFSAVLTRLGETHYKKGFVQGLPLEDLPRALLWIHSTEPRRRPNFAAWSWAGWEGPVEEDLMQVHGDQTTNFGEVDDPPLRVWRAGDDGHPELIYDFNPTPFILEEIKAQRLKGQENPNTESGEDEGSIPPTDDEDAWEDEEDDADSWKDIDEDSDYDSEEESDNDQEIDRESDPVTLLAKVMLEETPTVPPQICRNELLIEGIVVSLTFKDSFMGYSSDMSDDDFNERGYVDVEGQPKQLRLKFYGHNAGELVESRSEMEQEFLLLSRIEHFTTPKMYNVLLLLDWDGDTASRVGVANLRLDDVKQLKGVKPKIKLFKLK